MKSLGFEHCLPDTYGVRLIEGGSISIIAVVRVDDNFLVGRQSRCHRICDDLIRLVPSTTLVNSAAMSVVIFLGSGVMVSLIR